MREGKRPWGPVGWVGMVASKPLREAAITNSWQ